MKKFFQNKYKLWIQFTVSRKLKYIFWFTSLAAAISYFSLNVFYCDVSVKEALYCQKSNVFVTFFEENLRGHLFAGFLGLGGFLLSLKTFIVVTMKGNVYDTKEYKERWEKINEQIPSDSVALYYPLNQLSDLLFYAIAASFITAIAQLSFGLSGLFAFSLLCIALAIGTLLLLMQSMVSIKRNLDQWFEGLNEAHIKSIKKENENKTNHT